MAKKDALTFLGLPHCDPADLDGQQVAILGVAEASPYAFEKRSHSAKSPRVLRKISQTIARSLGQHDFDLDRTILPNKGDGGGLVDCGDVPTDPRDAEGNRARIRHEVRHILQAAAVPIILGGDDSVPIPVIAAYEGHGPLTILQVDAHVDWADSIAGNAHGYGSPMRRASEYDWVTGMVQVGIRGLGSGESWQHDDARAWGSQLVTSYALHAEGIEAALRHIPDGAKLFVSIDCDGIDPAVLPAVNMPTPGGLSYEDMVLLLRGAAAKARIAGLAILEYVPERDDRYRLSGQVAAKIATIGMALAQSAARAAD
ncbi:arginase family protein [Rhizorhabdus argentea]|uniref:arginase family protein n=1 Tax=Rhizorhabdus argentea TaxID=1387174 RepID=UPI0030EDDD26